MEQVTVLYLWKAEQGSWHRRPWVHQRRNQFGEYHHLLQEQGLDDAHFQRYFRLSRIQFEDLLPCVGGRISLRDTHYRRCIPAAERLPISLRSYTWPDSVSTCNTFLERGIRQVSAGNNLMLTLYR
ncbi:hypothetical protein CRENBAI_006083 [Crenichthys baileyi]|uniref:Uncharacterized protein n=1 Tax=Crenichthys baileyi TaxID=28760 RepID=A0AAV9QXG9_9TELE